CLAIYVCSGHTIVAARRANDCAIDRTTKMSLSQPLSRAQVREIDRRAIDEFAMPGILLMENAGGGAAQRVLSEFGGVRGGLHLVACGGGNNGGDGFVVARHLSNADVEVEVLLAADPEKLSPDA